MGRCFSPSLANLYLLDFDEKAMNDSRVSYFYRYLDDVFGLFLGSVDELLEYEKWLSTITPGIKVSLKFHNEFIDFLDTTIYKFNFLNVCELNTKVFFKETASHQLLDVKSFHPAHTSRGVIKSQILRYKRISSNYTNFKATCEIVFASLLKRGYTRRKLIKARNEIWQNKAMIKHDKNNKQAILPLVTTYNMVGTKLLGKWQGLLQKSSIAVNNKIIRAYRNTRNIKSYLVHSRLRTAGGDGGIVVSSINTHKNKTDFSDAGFKPCGTARCHACKMHSAKAVDTIISTTTGLHHKMQHSLSCSSQNIIYVITCNSCKRQYVGETTRTLRERLTDHKSNVRTNKPTPITIHFNQAGHSSADIRIIPIERIPDTRNSLLNRKQREKYWIQKLKTKYPAGLNEMPLNISF